MKTYKEEPDAKYKILRQIAKMRKEAREDGFDLNNRTNHESRLEEVRVGAFWMLVRLHICKRDDVEF